MRQLHWCVLYTQALCVLGRGYSRQKPVYELRAQDDPLDETLCKEPEFAVQLPVHIYKQIHAIWESHDGSDYCPEQIARTREVLSQMSPTRRRMVVRGKKKCEPPDVVDSLPDKLRDRILEIWKQRDPNGNCWEQQKKTRLILLNLPLALRKPLRPPALECALPHFIDRLEWDLQVQLRRLWSSYKKGEPCAKYVAKQLRLLQEHDISLESFDMPPATMFRRYELIHKLKRANRA